MTPSLIVESDSGIIDVPSLSHYVPRDESVDNSTERKEVRLIY